MRTDHLPLKNEAVILCPRGLAPAWHSQSHRDYQEYTGAFLLYGFDGKVKCQLPGKIIEWRGLPVDVYIFDPPMQLRKHEHGRCLQLLTPGSLWFKLHWEKPAKQFDEARAYVEQILAEAYS